MTESQLKQAYHNCLFVLDESSMVSNGDMLKFAKFIDQYNLRAVPLGDIKQIKGMSDGKPFEVLQHAKAMDVAYMNDIIRQKELVQNNQRIKGDDILLKSVEHISQAKVKASISRLKEQKNVSDIQYRSNRSVYQKIIKNDDLEDYIKQNVISTYKENDTNDKSQINLSTFNDKNKQVDKQVAKEEAYNSMVKGVAYDYLSRTDQTRSDTLLIAYSHKTRDAVTEIIREGLTEDNTLKNEDTLTRLRAVNLKDTQKKHNLSSYLNNYIICESGKTYYKINDVDKVNNTVELINVDTNKSKIIKPETINAERYSFFVKETMPLAENDLVTMRKTDGIKGYKTNDSFVVKTINDNDVILKNNDKEISLSKEKLTDLHWDYNYVKTVNSAQGATAKYTIGVDEPSSPLANLTRLYVALSRATDHYRMYTTEDKKLLLKVLQNDGDKYSALEVLREFITDWSYALFNFSYSNFISK